MSRPRSADGIFRAIADPTRRRILEQLEKGDHSVGDLMTTLNLRRTPATFHIGSLIAAGLVRQQRRGRHLMCSSNPRSLLVVHAWLARRLPTPRRTAV